MSNIGRDKNAIVPLNTCIGRQMLAETIASSPYSTLSMYYQMQINPTFCGVATSCALLNALEVSRPVSTTHGQYTIFTQDNFFSLEVEHIAPIATVAKTGMSLEQLGAALESHGADVEVRHAGDWVEEDLIRDITHRPTQRHSYVAVNYNRPDVDQIGGGHISPIAAVHKDSNRVLVMDTAIYRYPFAWLSISALYKAMATRPDVKSPITRGWLRCEAAHLE